jgi:hypothetical protein
MSLTRHLAHAGLAAACVIVLGIGSELSAQTSTNVCRRGLAAGAWELPDLGQDGWIDGWLYGPTNTSPRFHFTATLTDVQSPCLSCVEGDILGYLDDGIGPAPDYVVRGDYFGGWFTGEGTFAAAVFEPLSPSSMPVGRIVGSFRDPPTNVPHVGVFRAKWTICP